MPEANRAETPSACEVVGPVPDADHATAPMVGFGRSRTTIRSHLAARLRRRLAHVTPGQAGTGAYVVVAAVAQAWAGLAIVGVVWAGLALRRRHATRQPSSARLSPLRGLVALVLAAAAVAHSGLGRSILRTLVAVVLATALALAAIGEVLIAARFAAVVAAIAVALIVAVWHQVGRHRGHGTYRAGAGADEPYGDPAPASVNLAGVDAELVSRRLKALTPGQHRVIEGWAARHIAPYEPFPDE